MALGYALGIAIEAVQGGYLLVFASQIALAVGGAHISVVIDSGKQHGYGICAHLASADALAQVFDLRHHVGIKHLSRCRIIDSKFGK